MLFQKKCTILGGGLFLSPMQPHSKILVVQNRPGACSKGLRTTRSRWLLSNHFQAASSDSTKMKMLVAVVAKQPCLMIALPPSWIAPHPQFRSQSYPIFYHYYSCACGMCTASCGGGGATGVFSRYGNMYSLATGLHCCYTWAGRLYRIGP